MVALTRFGTNNAVLPKAGPKAYPLKLDFRAANSVEVDMQPEITAGHIDFISGVIVDNRQNANDLEIIVGGIGQRIGIPAGKQAHMPLLSGDSPQLIFQTPIDNDLLVPVYIVNFPVWPIIF